LRPIGLAVRREHDLRAACAQIARGLLPDLADTDQQDPATVQVAEDLLGKRGGRDEMSDMIQMKCPETTMTTVYE